MLLQVVSYGGRIAAFVVMLILVYIGFLAEDWYKPLWWLFAYVAFMNVLNLTLFLQKAITNRSSPKNNLTELAAALLTHRINNSHMEENIYFPLRWGYKENKIVSEINLMLSRIPEKVDQVGYYAVYTQPFSWSILTILFGKGTRPAMLVYKPNLYYLKTAIDDFITVMGLLLLLTSPNQVPWHFLSGINIGNSVIAVISIALTVILFRAVLTRIMKLQDTSEWKGFLDAILRTTMIPAAEEVIWGWIIPTCISILLIILSVPIFWAAGIAIAISVLFYTAVVEVNSWIEKIYVAVTRTIYCVVTLLFGFPLAVTLRVLINTVSFIEEWFIMRRLMRKARFGK